MEKIKGKTLSLFFTAVLMCGLPLTLFCQDSTGYIKALNYIKGRTKDKTILVCDSVAHLPFTMFSEQIDSIWNKGLKRTDRLLDSIDHIHRKPKGVIPGFKDLKYKGKNPAQIIYFSEFFDHMVIVEVVKQRAKNTLDHHSQTEFNDSTQYLLIFDNKYLLKKVFKVKVQYD